MNFYDVIFAQQKTKKDSKYFSEISDAINVLAGTETTYSPAEMGAAIIDAIPTEEVTDSIVSVTDAAAYPAEGLEFAIEPVQDLHGYYKPWPAGGGKNLVNWTGPSTITAQTTIAIISISDKTIYTASIQAVNSSGITGYLMFQFYRDNVLVAESRVDIPDGTNARVSAVKDASGIDFDSIRIGIAGALSGYSITASDAQVEKSSTATSYEPYSNICPISGWTGVNGERTGKNLYSGEISNYGSYTNDGTFVSDSAYGCSNMMPIKPGINYTLVINSTYTGGGYQLQAAFFDSQKNFISLINKNSGGSGKRDLHLSDIPINAKYVRLAYIRSSNSRGLYIDSVPNSYEPYQGTSIPIAFPTEAGTVYGGKVDVVNGKLIVDRAEVDLGNLSWTEDSTSETNHKIWVATVLNKINRMGSIISDTYEITSRALINMPENSIRDVGNSSRIYICDSSYDNETDFTTAVTRSKLVYELATPIEYDITPQQVQMLLGDNNIWCDTGDTTVEYKVDLGRYIEKLKANQTTPQLSLSRQAVSLEEEPITQEIKADVLEPKSAEAEEQEEQEEQQQEGDAD